MRVIMMINFDADKDLGPLEVEQLVEAKIQALPNVNVSNIKCDALRTLKDGVPEWNEPILVLNKFGNWVIGRLDRDGLLKTKTNQYILEQIVGWIPMVAGVIE